MSEEKFSSVTHYTQVDVQPGGINIQHVEHLHQADILKALGIELAIKQKGQKTPATNPEPESAPSGQDEELFHFVHPELDDKAAWSVHEAVKRVVARQGIKDICQYLRQLRKENKVLLPQSPSAAYIELVRLGMPEGKGFNESTFRNYYTNK